MHRWCLYKFIVYIGMYAEELCIFKSCIFLQYETRYSSLLSCIWWESKSCVSTTYNIELLRLATFKISFSFPQMINHKKVKPEDNGTQYVYAGLTFMNMHPGSLDQVLLHRKTTLFYFFFLGKLLDFGNGNGWRLCFPQFVSDCRDKVIYHSLNNNKSTGSETFERCSCCQGIGVWQQLRNYM